MRKHLIIGIGILAILMMMSVASAPIQTKAAQSNPGGVSTGEFLEWDVLQSSSAYQNWGWLNASGDWLPHFGINISTGDKVNVTISHFLAGSLGFNGTWGMGNTTIPGSPGAAGTHLDVYTNLNLYWWGVTEMGLIYTVLDWETAKASADASGTEPFTYPVDWEITTWTHPLDGVTTVHAIKFNSTQPWQAGGDWNLTLIYHWDTGVLLYGMTDASASSQTLELEITQATWDNIKTRTMLDVSVSSSSATVDSGATSTITVNVEDDGTPVDRAFVTLSAEAGGSISSVTDNGDGTYTATFTAPSVTTQTTVTISGTATKSGFVSGLNQTTITVNAKSALSVEVTASPTTVDSGATSTITVNVTEAGAAVTGATITLSSSEGGTFSSMTDNGDGTYTVTFTAPTLTSNKDTTITANAWKAGSVAGEGTTTITIKAEEEGTDWAFYGALSAAIVLGILVVYLAFMKPE